MALEAMVPWAPRRPRIQRPPYPLPSAKIDDHSVPGYRVFRFGQAIEHVLVEVGQKDPFGVDLRQPGGDGFIA